MRDQPAWLKLCEANLVPLLEHLSVVLLERNDLDVNVQQIPLLASYHLHQCILSSIDAKEKGRYSVAMALLRQCVETLTIIEVGLQSAEFATNILTSWSRGRLTQGEVRQKLESEIWVKYGHGLWSESWADYFGNLARAVQPYAHYSFILSGWQYAILNTMPDSETNEGTIFYAKIGLGSKDLLKASRVSIFITLIGWTIARLLEENGILCPMRGDKLKEWGISIGNSELLDGDQSSWSDIFLPFTWLNNNGPQGVGR